MYVCTVCMYVFMNVCIMQFETVLAHSLHTWTRNCSIRKVKFHEYEMCGTGKACVIARKIQYCITSVCD